MGFGLWRGLHVIKNLSCMCKEIQIFAYFYLLFVLYHRVYCLVFNGAEIEHGRQGSDLQ